MVRMGIYFFENAEIIEGLGFKTRNFWRFISWLWIFFIETAHKRYDGICFIDNEK